MDTNAPGTATSLVPHSVLSAAVHELRGPLGVARGYLRMLGQAEGSDPRARKAIDEAAQAAERMAHMLDEVSHYARLASGDARLHPQSVSLGAVFDDARAHWAAVPLAVPVTLDLRDPSDIELSADRARLATSIAALLTALSRAQVEDTALLVEATQPAEPGRVSVSMMLASGLGGSPAERPPRLDRSGAGLSLALAELTVRLHGGSLSEIWVDRDWIGYRLRL